MFQVFTGFCPKGFGFGFGAVGLEFTVAVEVFALKHVFFGKEVSGCWVSSSLKAEPNQCRGLANSIYLSESIWFFKIPC